MKNIDKYTKSLQLMDDFIAETAADDLKKLLKKYENLEIEGPTFDEYLISLENSYESLYCTFRNESELKTDEYTQIGVHKNDDYDNYYIPPGKSLKPSKKDSGSNSESFFFSILAT